jgi:alpha-glucosidase
MPEDNLHRADAEFGGPGPHARFHNVYGTLMVKATRDGIAAANPDRRPFVLSRALYLGGQRYAASWTGDNSADWYHLESSIPMVLNLGLSGQPFCGPDIGGFAGNGPQGEAGGTMFARWMGIGALLPFARAHTAKGNIDKEPWSFGPKVEATCKAAIERRYRLLPYIYTLFHESSTKGTPIARPLFFADPKDPSLRSEDDGFFLGNSLMVIGQMVPDRTRAVVLPKGDWYRLSLDDAGANTDDLPDLYLKPGTITARVFPHN